MAGRFSNYLNPNLLDHTFGNNAYSAPTTIYLALCTATILPSDTGSTITEASYGGYVRTTKVNDGTTWDSAVIEADSGVKRNGATIEFAEVTSGTDTITDVAITDALTAGNILAYGELAVAKPISTGDKLIFEAGGIVISLT